MPTGFEKLGMALAGGNRDAKFTEGRTDAARLQSLLSEAAIKSDQAKARAMFADALASKDPNRIIAAATQAGMGTDFNASSRGVGQMTQNDALAQALEGVESGKSIDQVNPLLAINNGKPVTTTSIQQGQVFNPLAAPTQNINLTDIGEALLGTQRAKTGQANASAEASRARAEKSRAAPSKPAKSSRGGSQKEITKTGTMNGRRVTLALRNGKWVPIK